MSESPTAPESPVDLTARVMGRLTRPIAGAPPLIDARAAFRALDVGDRLPQLGERGIARGLPAVVVLPISDQVGRELLADPDDGQLGMRTETIAVLVGAQAPNDASGRKIDHLTPALEAVRHALIGWAPDGRPSPQPPPDGVLPQATWPLDSGRWTPLRLTGGRLLDVDGRQAWWRDEYESRRLLHGASAPEAAEGSRPSELCVAVNGAPPVPLTDWVAAGGPPVPLLDGEGRALLDGRGMEISA